MAKLFGSQLDLQKIPVKNIVVEQASAAPSSPVVGQMYFNTSDSKLYVCTNATGPVWTQADNAGIGGGTLAIQDENAAVASGVTQLDFQGAGVTATAGSGEVIVTIPGGGAPSGTAGGDLGGSYPNPTVTKAQNNFDVGGAGQMTAVTFNQTGLNANVSVLTAKVSGDANPRVNLTSGGVLNLGTGSSPTDVNLYWAGSNILKTDDTLQVAGGLQVSAGASVSGGVLNMNTQKIQNVVDPTLSSDVATKNYVDSVVTGLDAKASVKAATTITVTLAGGTPNTLDGISLAANDRVLVKNQTAGAENGIYTVQTLGSGSNGTWARASDMDAWTEVPAAFTWVEQGTTQGDTGWVVTADQGGTLGTTAITWTQFTGAASFTDGIGLLKTGNTLDVRLDNTTIEAPSDILQVKDGGITTAKIGNGQVDLTTKVTGTLPMGNGGTGSSSVSGARSNLSSTANPLPQKFVSTLGAMTAGVELTATHNLNTKDIVPAFRLVSTDVVIDFTWRAVDVNTIGITSDVAQAASAIRLTVVG